MKSEMARAKLADLRQCQAAMEGDKCVWHCMKRRRQRHTVHQLHPKAKEQGVEPLPGWSF